MLAFLLALFGSIFLLAVVPAAILIAMANAFPVPEPRTGDADDFATAFG